MKTEVILDLPNIVAQADQWTLQTFSLQYNKLLFKTCTCLKQKKIKRFLTKSKGCRDKESATGPQCKPTRSKHGMVTRLTC